MRISTQNIFDSSVSLLQKRQQQMQEAQQRLTSGKKVERASDDPTAAARAERAMTAIGRIDANQRALEASRNSMQLSESALGDGNELLLQVREALVAAGNASYSDPERLGLANKIAGLRTQLLSIANRTDGSGNYLFGGLGSAEPPFLDQPGGVSYTGTPGAVQTGNLENFPMSVDGRSAWMQARTGNGYFSTDSLPNANTSAPAKSWIDAGRVTDPSALTGQDYEIQISGSGSGATYTVTNTTTGSVVKTDTYVSGKAIEFDGIAVAVTGTAEDGDKFSVEAAEAGMSVFDVLDRAFTELSTPQRTSTQISQANAGRLRDLDSVMVNLQNVRSQLGEALNNLDGSESRMASAKLFNQTEKSSAEDLDMIQGISEFQNQQSGYDAALKAYASVQKLSLLQYVNF